MIEIKNLCFGYKKSKNVLENVNLNLKKGCIHGLFGKNGIGKTTLLKLIGGLQFPDKGEVKVGEFTPSERKVAFLADMFFISEELYDSHLTIEKYVKINSVFYPNFSQQDFEAYLKDFEIEDTKQYLHKLSYGTKKKIFISFGLACHCKLILLDEPTNGLDVDGIIYLIGIQELGKFNKKFKKVKTRNGRLSTLKRKRNVFAISILKCFFYQNFCSVFFHNTKTKMFSVLRNILIEAIFTRKITK